MCWSSNTVCQVFQYISYHCIIYDHTFALLNYIFTAPNASTASINNIDILLLSKLDPEKHKSWSSSRASGPLHRHNKELPSLLLQYFYCHHPNLRCLTQAWIIMKHLESNLPASNKQAMSRHFLQNAFQIQDSTFTFHISHSIYCSPNHLYHQHLKSVLKYCISIEFHLSYLSALSYVCLYFSSQFCFMEFVCLVMFQEEPLFAKWSISLRCSWS